MHLLKQKDHKQMLNEQGDGPNPDKKYTQSSETHQPVMLV